VNKPDIETLLATAKVLKLKGDEYTASMLEQCAAALRDAEDELQVLRRIEKGEVWYWQGDGWDFPQSLGCPVIMRPEKLRAMLEAIRNAQGEREKVLDEAQQAIINACQACDGQGFAVTTTTGHGHICEGDERLCQTSCPVPVPEQTQEQCEYCGRPCDAIRALLSNKPTKPVGDRGIE
jgi:hypothetical protein